MAVFLLAIIGVGLFISSLSMTQQQAILGGLRLPGAGGHPVRLTPAPSKTCPTGCRPSPWANPLRYFMTIVRGIFLKDISAGLVWQQTWPMAVIAAVTLSTATWLFKKRME